MQIRFVVVCACLIACRAERVEDRDARLDHVRQSPATAFAELQALYESSGLPVSHWPDSLLADSLTRAGAEGPCGPEHELWVKGLTPVAKRHTLDRVIEFDSARIIQSWPFPANETPIGVRDDALLLSAVWFHDSLKVDSASLPLLAVRPDGSLRVERVGTSLPQPALVTCPPFAIEKKSDYWRCFEFVDLVSHTKRRLGYNGPCT